MVNSSRRWLVFYSSDLIDKNTQKALTELNIMVSTDILPRIDTQVYCPVLMHRSTAQCWYTGLLPSVDTQVYCPVLIHRSTAQCWYTDFERNDHYMAVNSSLLQVTRRPPTFRHESKLERRVKLRETHFLYIRLMLYPYDRPLITDWTQTYLVSGWTSIILSNRWKQNPVVKGIGEGT